MEAQVEAEAAGLMETGLLRSYDLYKYLLETSVYPLEADSLKELRALTSTHPMSIMGTNPDSGQLMTLLLKLINARRTIEIGVFTGYSLLATALAIPEDGKITAIDPDRSSYEIGLPVIKKAGVEHKIDFIQSEALPVLEKLLEDHDNHGAFDFAFVDADKHNYVNYHEKLLGLVKPGGIVIYDNTLWGGTVVMAESSVPAPLMRFWKPVTELNKYLAADTRIQICQIPVGDGMTICRLL
ncbi:putative caffeoyl-CoA O-methyltransferase At4g26220 [Dorcoceras hygrometricum]|uniref:Putative caffeoyl-CoA O-methyltransferase At4g26220 n=1 Tax=Dorcoceras hygrometricum TaxID=472368 RepID=A0A2Z7AKH5_9LAMI|nr:putative caffeoyl-CoA O-methyltransferase At4g26220 [Dorcoceras hygrometricum]